MEAKLGRTESALPRSITTSNRWRRAAGLGPADADAARRRSRARPAAGAGRRGWRMRSSPSPRSAGCWTSSQPYAESLPDDHDDAALVRVARREYERAIKVPAGFVAELYEHANLTFQAWEKARPGERLRLGAAAAGEDARPTAGARPSTFAPYDHIMDPLIDESDYGMTVRHDPAAVRAAARPACAAGRGSRCAREPVDDACLKQTLPRGRAVAVRAGGGPGDRLRLRARPAGQGARTPSRRSSRWATCGSPPG